METAWPDELWETQKKERAYRASKNKSHLTIINLMENTGVQLFSCIFYVN